MRKIPTKKLERAAPTFNQPQETALPQSKPTQEIDYLDCDTALEANHSKNHNHKKSSASKSPENTQKNKINKESLKAKNCKINIKELRSKLIRKMPDLKDKITMLADK